MYDLRLSNTTRILQKKYGLLVLGTRHFLVVHPLLNKILDPPLGWTLQRPRAGGKRCSSHVKEHLKASRFDTGEESRRKADPEQVAIDIREMPEINTRNGCFQ